MTLCYSTDCFSVSPEFCDGAKSDGGHIPRNLYTIGTRRPDPHVSYCFGHLSKLLGSDINVGRPRAMAVYVVRSNGEDILCGWEKTFYSAFSRGHIYNLSSTKH